MADSLHPEHQDLLQFREGIADPLPTDLGSPLGRCPQRCLDRIGRTMPGDERRSQPAFSLTSARWWFENRETGRLTVAQFPNWPLFAIAATMAARRLSGPGGLISDGAGVLVPVLWLYWGADELVRGVNPWRRLLGAAVIGWQVAGLFLA